MKEKIARFGVEYASRRLGLSEIEVHFKPQSFFKCDQTNASFLAEGYYVVISSDWLETANELEILKCAFHETRHAYQRACIDFPDLIYHDPKVVEVWLKEFDDYKRPGHDQYLNQEIEKDAIAFSDKLIEDMINENIKKVKRMPKLYDYDAVEKQVELISEELEPKIVKEICRELKLSSEYEKMTTSELHRALGLQLGFCYFEWRMKKRVLKRDYGINWKSPSDLNPEINFD